MLINIILFFFSVGAVQCQNWAASACLVDHQNYFQEIAQKAVTRIEKEIQWSNLKLLELNRNINQELFNLHVKGTVNYTNGFTVAIQKIDVTNIQNVFSNLNANGTMQALASVRGLLHFRNLKIGYDILADLENFGPQRYTGLYMFTICSIQYEIRKNVNTNEISLTSRVTTLTPGYRTMEYMPNDSISEILSRDFMPSLLWDSFDKWDIDYIHPFMLDVAKNTEYPEIRFGTC